MSAAHGQHHLFGGYHGGWKRSPEDRRDRVADTSGLTILDEVDPRKDPLYPAIWDQMRLGCCTAEAVDACLQYDLALHMGRKARRRSILDTYYQERKSEGSPTTEDTGAYGRTGFKVAQNIGLLLEVNWPFEESTYLTNFAKAPPTTGPRGGKLTRQKLTRPYVHPNPSIEEHKAALSNKQFIAFGFDVYRSFEFVDSSGVVPMPGANDPYEGGHEVVEIGYLAEYPNHVLCRNSWSTSWGADGHFLMPWAYVLDSNLASDHRTIVRAAA